MSERKNIDRFFQERFKDFEAEPSEISWEKIESRLEEKKKRRIVPFWYKLGGIAAALLLGGLLLIGENSRTGEIPGANTNTVVIGKSDAAAENPDATTDKENPVVVNPSESQNPVHSGMASETPTSEEEDDLTTANWKDAAKTSKNAIAVQENDNNVSGATSGHNKLKKEKAKNTDAVRNTTARIASGTKSKRGTTAIQDSENAIAQNEKENQKNQNERNASQHNSVNNTAARFDNSAQNQTPKQDKINENNALTDTKFPTQTATGLDAELAMNKLDTAAVATAVPNALGELLNEKENNKSVNESGQKINRWQIYSHLAPIYLSSFTEGSPIDPSLAQNQKQYQTSLSYGVGGSYAISKKLSVRGGVNAVAMEYTTRDVAFNQSLSAARHLKNLDNNSLGQMLNIQSNVYQGGIYPGDALSLNNDLLKKFEGSISQKTGYIEVPVELSYKLLDSKFGIEVIGGFSTLFLQENEISLISSGSEVQIGKANNLNSTHFSTNLGLGLKYDIFRALQFKVEPMLKYQINPYTEAGNFKPYFLGIYTGFKYRF